MSTLFKKNTKIVFEHAQKHCYESQKCFLLKNFSVAALPYPVGNKKA